MGGALMHVMAAATQSGPRGLYYFVLKKEFCMS